MLSWNDIKGVGTARRSALEQAGFFTPEQLVERLPIGYRDTTRCTSIKNLSPGMEATFVGEIVQLARLARVGNRTYVNTKVRDATGTIACTWFSAPWMIKKLPLHKTLRFYARIVRQKTGVQPNRNQQHSGQMDDGPKNETLCAVNPIIVEEPSIQPVYTPIDKLPPKTMRSLIAAALSDGQFDELLPEKFRVRYSLCPRRQALAQAHFPSSQQMLAEARHRLAFEELTLFQMHLQAMRGYNVKGVQIPSVKEDADAFWKVLPFEPTRAQRCVLEEIRLDLLRETPMARLVQGDVGCGKTAIAFGALVLTVRAGYQGVLMAPTEVLAAQHYRSAVRLLSPLGIRCVLLTGKLPAASRRDARTAAANGKADVIIGTHALISESVSYHKLGLAITDEQHRFGVRQRTALSDRTDGLPANVLVLSATPIPRTLSLILYGDLDVSVVDELPKGRIPVKTHIVPENKREGLYGFLRAQVAAGHQAYVICPLVAESERMEGASAAEMYQMLRDGPLASFRVGLVHGRQKPEEKDGMLQMFADGLVDVLVSTTVVEVGVDVPNATVMVIEDADRFGLSQLHQLRGRVGRGASESYCFLLAMPNERLDALVGTTDGFVIAQKDLEQRGPGEWFGTRQHGTPAMPGAALGADVRLLEETQRAVRELLEDALREEEREEMQRAAKRRFGEKIGVVGRN